MDNSVITSPCTIIISSSKSLGGRYTVYSIGIGESFIGWEKLSVADKAKLLEVDPENFASQDREEDILG